jgi:hypothetical protein
LNSFSLSWFNSFIYSLIITIYSEIHSPNLVLTLDHTIWSTYINYWVVFKRSRMSQSLLTNGTKTQPCFTWSCTIVYALCCLKKSCIFFMLIISVSLIMSHNCQKKTNA